MASLQGIVDGVIQFNDLFSFIAKEKGQDKAHHKNRYDGYDF